MRPKFSEIKYNGGSAAAQENSTWMTSEQIPVKGVYTAKDLEGMEHLSYAAGIAPFLRGPYSTMYVQKPWTIRQYAGFSTAEESTPLTEKSCGRTEGSLCCFDLATHRGYDATTQGLSVMGKAGVSISVLKT